MRLSFFILIFLLSCSKNINNTTTFKDNCATISAKYPEIDGNKLIIEKDDTLNYDYFKLLICYRTTIISKKYLQKYTTINKDSIGGYRLFNKSNIDVLVLKKYSSDSEMIFLLYDNKLLKELDKIEVSFSNFDTEGKIFYNKDAWFVDETGCIHIETFDPIYHNRKIKQSEKKNIKVTKYCVIDKKWSKQE